MKLQKISEGRYQTEDGRYQVTLEPSGKNHGAVTIEDTQGASLADTHGDRMLSKVCRCGGLLAARILISRALGIKAEYAPPRYDEEYFEGVAWLDTL